MKREVNSRSKYTSILENSLAQRLRFLALIILVMFILAVIITTFVIYTKNNPGSGAIVKNVKGFVFDQIKQFTPLGLLYTSFFGNILYSTLPIEAFFYYGLTKGNPLFITLILVLTGVFCSEIINYFAGRKLSRYVFYLISPKKIYQAKRIANKYGSYAVFFFSFIPSLPSPLLTFTLGIAKYKPSRVFTLLFIGATLKFTAILIVYHFFGAWLAKIF